MIGFSPFLGWVICNYMHKYLCVNIYIHISLILCQIQRFPFLHSLIRTISCLFDKRYTNNCEVLSHSGFDLHSLMINDTEQLCVCLLAIYVSLGKRRVFKYLAYLQIRLLVIFLLSCASSLYSFDINTLLDMWLSISSPIPMLSFRFISD